MIKKANFVEKFGINDAENMYNEMYGKVLSNKNILAYTLSLTTEEFFSKPIELIAESISNVVCNKYNGEYPFSDSENAIRISFDVAIDSEGKREDYEILILPCSKENFVVKCTIFEGTTIDNKDSKLEGKSVVLVRICRCSNKDYCGVVKLYDTILTEYIPSVEKLRILNDEFGIKIDNELCNDIVKICELYSDVVLSGIQIGITGTKVAVVHNLRKLLSVNDIARAVALPVSDVKEILA